MDNRIKNTVQVRIEGINLYCYILEGGKRFIGEGIRAYFKGNPTITLSTLIDVNDDKVMAYDFMDVIDHLNLKALHVLARFGLEGLVDLSLSTKHKENELGDFDKLIKKALDYNPKKK